MMPHSSPNAPPLNWQCFAVMEVLTHMDSVRTDEVPHWYVIHTNPRQEERSHDNLMAWKVETLAPKIKERTYHPITGRPRYVTRPFFSRYIFARFKMSELLHKIRFTRGVHSVVSFGDAPIPVEDDVIDLLRSRINAEGFVETREEFKPGDEVVINSGPLKNFVGIFQQEMKDSDRVMLLLKTVNYQAHVKIERELIAKVKN
jgi:transcriptional antiterminator RfaH